MKLMTLIRTVTNFFRRTWLLLGLLVVATAFCVRPVSDIDVQWHLKIGAWMLDNGQVVREDFYSVSKWGREWTSVPWLYECLMAWLVRQVGWMGPTVWQWLVALAVTVQTAYLIWLYRERGRRGASGARESSPWDWAWPGLTVPAALVVLETLRAAEVRFQHRPEMTTHVLLGTYLIVLTLWERWSEGEWASKRFPRVYGVKVAKGGLCVAVEEVAAGEVGTAQR